MSSSACILGLSGTTVTKGERAFFRDLQPWGFILFRRNIDTPEQVAALTADLRSIVGRDDAPILIDQEGGRVQRMGPPHWRAYPTGRAYGRLAANDPLIGREMTRLGARLIAHDLTAVGINVDCVPVLDVPAPNGHEIIGDRAYGEDPATVAAHGRAAAEGLIAGGVLPIIKHIPGHGRAMADSHLALPVVDCGYDELEARDFAPFRVLSDMPMAMTAHVVYAAIDPKRPATTSKRVIKRVIREAIGFNGLLMGDDLSMQALSGSFEARTQNSFKAGCDVVLHCNGEMAEMRAIAEACPTLSGKSKRRAESALGRLAKAPEPLDHAEAVARFEAMFAVAQAA